MCKLNNHMKSSNKTQPLTCIFPPVCFWRILDKSREFENESFPCSLYCCLRLYPIAEFNPLINSMISAKNCFLLRSYSPFDAASRADTFNAISEFCFTDLGKKELGADIHTCLSELTTWNSPPSLKWNFQCNNISGDDFPKHPFNNVDDTFHMWNNRYLTSVQKRLFAVSS